jgi:hypothetical protein
MNTKYDEKTDELIHPVKIKENHSQAYQDLFVLTMLSGKKNGRYLEIGGNHPSSLNNTYLLETEFNWQGISVEINQQFQSQWTNRLNKCYLADATTFDWREAIKNKGWKRKRFDYVSIDCEPPDITLKALENLPLDDYRFSVITFESDLYMYGPECRDIQRRILNDLGYQIVARDVANGGNQFEDWWIDPQVIDNVTWGPFISHGAEARTLFIK